MPWWFHNGSINKLSCVKPFDLSRLNYLCVMLQRTVVMNGLVHKACAAPRLSLKPISFEFIWIVAGFCWSCASVTHDSWLDPFLELPLSPCHRSRPITTTCWGNENVVYPNPPHPALLPPHIHFSYFLREEELLASVNPRNRTSCCFRAILDLVWITGEPLGVKIFFFFLKKAPIPLCRLV